MSDLGLPRAVLRAASAASRRSLPLSLRGVRVVADRRALLDIDTLEIAGGGPTLIVGPNGAGKSLLLRILHGLVEPAEGAVAAGGRRLDRAARSRQAMVFQRPVLLRRSVAGNLDFVLARRGLPQRERHRRRQALLAEGGLQDRARQPARSLSGGEQQRLALLRAMAGDPEVLFLDEPTSHLDPAATRAIEALIAAAVGRGTKIVMVTHDVAQARRLAEEAIVMHRGAVIEAGRDALHRPRSASVRAFLNGELLA